MSTTTKFWTWAEISADVRSALDLEGEVFISPDELMRYGNEAVDICEAEIHTLYEDYFLTKSKITLVDGTDSYPFPSDIYGMKVRRITYRNGADVYTLRRARNWRKFEQYELERISSNSREYVWFPLNTTPGDPQILLTPPAYEDGEYLTVWYIRQANRFVTSADVCDIPEFVHFVIQWIKMRCYEKEGHPNLGKAIADMGAFRELMVGTLQTMVPDADNTIEADFSAYNEMV